MEKHFEVKTGKNKGFYIVTKAEHILDRDVFNYMADKWGMLPYEYNAGFYLYHHINPHTEVVWTHTRYTGHEFSRRVYQSMTDYLGHSSSCYAFR